MKAIYKRVAFATVLTGLALPTLSNAQDLQLDSNQPTISGTLGQGSEENRKPSISAGDSGVYIIQLRDPSLAVYDGGINNMSATSAKANGDRRLNLSSAASASYGNYLQGKQDAFIADCEAALGHELDVSYNYQTVFNGVAITLTKAEADIVAAAPSVKTISRERIEVPLTDVGPQWIGAPSLWGNGHHRSWRQKHSMGEGIVVAVLDTGINSDNPSFADIGGDGYDRTFTGFDLLDV